MKLSSYFCVFSLFLKVFTFADETVPKLINYQGKLTDASGTALSAGNYSVRFELYDNAAGGTLIWGETREVTLVNGVFNVALGGGASTPVVGAAINDIGFAFGSAQRFLQINVVSGPGINGEQALLPRQQMVSVPFALSVPFMPGPGAIVMHHSYGGICKIPRGWFACTGKPINEANYNAIHGEGAWAEDGISLSPLNGKLSPNFTNRYPVGSAQLAWNGQDQVPFVGNPSHRISLAHSHTVNPHNHRWIYKNSNGYSMNSFNSAGNGVLIDNAQPNTGRRIYLNTAGEGAVGAYYTENASPGTDSKLTEPQSVMPESIEVVFILKLK